MVRGKFIVEGLMKSSVYIDGSARDTIRVSLRAIKASDGPMDENAVFSAASPAGTISIDVAPGAAIETFKGLLGQAMYVDFTPAES